MLGCQGDENTGYRVPTPQFAGAPDSAWAFREVFPEEVTPALGFERWVEVQSEGLLSVCAELGFGDFQQLEYRS